MVQTYDLIFLLAGENDSYFRSRKAFELLRKGIAGSIFISGGDGGFAKIPLSDSLPDNQKSHDSGLTRIPLPVHKSDGQKSYDFLRQLGIYPEKLYLDTRSRETLGNFAFPAARPLIGNPNLAEDVKSILVVTDESHMKRALHWAHKILPLKNLREIDYIFSEGPKEEDLKTIFYDHALHHRLKYFPEHEPERIVKFLYKEHPFYRENHFHDSVGIIQLELAITCIKWEAPRGLVRLIEHTG